MLGAICILATFKIKIHFGLVVDLQKMAHPWLLLLDFDHTVIDVNSDTYVIKEASKTVAEAQNELMKSMQWTDLM